MGDPASFEPLLLREMRVQSRYRFADRGEFPVDVMVLSELTRQFGDSIYSGSANGIFARSMDKLTVALNAIARVEFGSDVLEAFVLDWAAGATYELHPKANIGVEAFGRVEDKLAASLGPALAIAPSSRFWFTLTAGFGMTDDAPVTSARLILGVEL